MWLGGTAAWSGLNRPGDAMVMFDRYSQGGRSLQFLSKGLYWAGKAAAAARPFPRVLAVMFSGDRQDAALWLPQVPLDEMYARLEKDYPRG